MISVSDDFRAI